MTRPTQNSQLKIQNFALVLLLLLYLLVALAHATLAPLTTGPDELAHYEYVRFITEQGRLPLDRQERAQASYKSDQPPLYHLITALPASLVDPTGPPFLKRVGDHPRRQLIERTRHAWGLYNTEDEQWPYRAEVLRWHVGRWVAILFGAATVAVTYFIAREVFAKNGGEIFRSPLPLCPSAPLLALAAAAVVAFIPRFALTGSMLNYETMLAFFAALFLWVLIRMANEQIDEPASQRASESADQRINEPRNPITHHVSRFLLPASRSTLHAVLLGLFFGLAITTKLSALILPLETIIALWLIKRDRGWSLTRWFQTVAITGVTALLAVSWWFGFILYQFNTVAQDGLWVGLLRPLIAADASDATTNRLLSFLTGGQAGFTGAIENLDSGPPWEWLATLFRTFWVVGIEGVQPLGRFGLLVALAWCLLAAYGLLIAWRQNDRRSPTADRRDENLHSPISTPQFPVPDLQPPVPRPRLTLALLLLHLAAAFVLPLIRYATTFSLADTAQGRHILFLTAPAFAILLVWGVTKAITGGRWQVAGCKWQVAGRRVAGEQVGGSRIEVSGARPPHSSFPALRSPLPAPRLMPLVPALFLLLWSLVQLWTMRWAYLPPLPVSTQPEATRQAAHQLNQALNDYVTLVGYTNQRDGQMLRLELIWQATAISPVDYLTEVSLIDSQDNLIRQWVGYPADGRYPTRAWDEGDIVRDPVWLPLVGLESGAYQLRLNLLANTLSPPPTPVPQQLDSPLTLTSIALENSSTPTASEFQIWQNGRVLTEPKYFRYRETILVTLNPSLTGQPRQVQIVAADPTAHLIFEPERDLGDSLVFIVGPDWSSGAYRLQITLEATGQQLVSDPLIQVVDRWQRQFTVPEIRYPLEANFANRVELLGYELGTRRAEAGGGLPVMLYWQALDWLGEDYIIFTRLLAADQTSHGGRDRLPREGYRTLYWAPREIIVDPFGVPVDSNAPDGVYYINVGLYKEVNGQAASLPLVQNGQPVETTSVNIGPVKIGGPPPGVIVKQADPQIQLNRPFGDAAELILLGYTITDQNSKPIQNSEFAIQNSQFEIPNLKLTLYWQSEQPLPTDYTTFVHLRNNAGEMVAQQDQPPLNGAYPTSLWDPGEIIADEIIVPLPSDLPAGSYRVVVGLYDFQTGARLTVPGWPNNEVTLTTLELTR